MELSLDSDENPVVDQLSEDGFVDLANGSRRYAAEETTGWGP
jgi:hypothetical protein